MVPAKQLGFDVIANPVYQVNFKERFASDKVPYYGFFFEIFLVVKNIVNGTLGNSPWHAFFLVLSDEIAILASQLAILCNYKSNILAKARFPCQGL